ncbi:MAG: sigma-70 family RNA polymerase sigma factor [Bacteroidia bacterium]|nr:sigma-70 family RNA polymerase sigma factor [Bacteroidia bacterium]
MPKQLNDIEVWKRLKGGDRKAFEQVYRSEIQVLISYGRKYSSDLELVEDCVHDLFIYIWKQRESLSDTDSIRRYLLVAMRHRVLASKNKRKKVELKEPDEHSFQQESSIEERITLKEQNEENAFIVSESLQVLSSRQREAIYLRYMNEMSYEDICEIMKINYQSVRNLISTGLKKLNFTIKNKNL